MIAQSTQHFIITNFDNLEFYQALKIIDYICLHDVKCDTTILDRVEMFLEDAEQEDKLIVEYLPPYEFSQENIEQVIFSDIYGDILQITQDLTNGGLDVMGCIVDTSGREHIQYYHIDSNAIPEIL